MLDYQDKLNACHSKGWWLEDKELREKWFFLPGVENNRSEGVASMLKSSLIFLA